jgi:polyhydroxyalkanoate synthesis regulator phasin
MSTRLHPITLMEFDRLRRLRRLSRSEALAEAAESWVAREITREGRNEHVSLLREAQERRREINERMDRKIARLTEGLNRR